MLPFFEQVLPSSSMFNKYIRQKLKHFVTSDKWWPESRARPEESCPRLSEPVSFKFS